MTPINICGPSYQFTDVYAAVEDTVNWYPVVNESPDETAFKLVLEESPGNAPFGQLPVPSGFIGPGQGLLQYQDVLYGVSFVTGAGCSYLWYMDSGGTYHDIGPLTAWVSYTGSVSMVGNGNGQILITGAYTNTAYVYNVNTGVLTSLPPATGFLGANVCTFQDGYAIVLNSGTRQIQISGTIATPVGDFTQWSAANVSELVGQADYLVNLISSREYLRIFGERRTQIFYNAGASGIGGFPFQSYNSTFIETGLGAVYSLCDLGDSLMWIGQDARGMRACWRDFGFQPQKVSTFAIEQTWQAYSTVADAVAFPFIWKGHSFYQITFPTAGFTWVYDATVSQLTGKSVWHRRSFNHGGTPTCRQELYHAYCYGKHLVLSLGTYDGNPGAVYQYADSYSDCANVGGTQTTQPIIPSRTVPRLFQNRNRITIPRLRVAMQQGTGSGSYPNPQLMLAISRDGGNTFGSPISAPVGAAGAYTQMTEYHGLGYARDWVLKFSGDGSPTPFNIQGAWADATGLGS